jgi:hypothetical protein
MLFLDAGPRGPWHASDRGYNDRVNIEASAAATPAVPGDAVALAA